MFLFIYEMKVVKEEIGLSSGGSEKRTSFVQKKAQASSCLSYTKYEWIYIQINMHNLYMA